MRQHARLDSFLDADRGTFDFDALLEAYDWARAMAQTPQDPKYHGEGDVWTHTRMVCEALTRDEAWPRLDADERRLMLIAALLHDVGKPATTYTDDDGRIRSPDHSVRGESIARRVLWLEETAFALREEVCALVRNHMQPRYLPEQRDPSRRTFALSLVTRCDRLALLARADTLGRIAPDASQTLAAIASFAAFAQRHHCLDRPRAFSSDHTRFLYFRRRVDRTDVDVPGPSGPQMTIMSGLPGSGKDTWIERHAGDQPVVSLDAIRTELSVDPAAADQSEVVRLGRERAARLLAGGTDFIWNATTLIRRHREALLELALPYDPRIRFVHVDAPPSLLLPRNRARSGKAVVPEDVMERMTWIWQPPDLTEAHELLHVLHEDAGAQRRAS